MCGKCWRCKSGESDYNSVSEKWIICTVPFQYQKNESSVLHLFWRKTLWMNSGWKRKVSKAHREGKSQEPDVDSVYSAVSSRGAEIEGQKYGVGTHMREVLCCGAVIISDGFWDYPSFVMFVSQGPKINEIAHSNLGNSRRLYNLTDYDKDVSRMSGNYKRLHKCPELGWNFYQLLP